MSRKEQKTANENDNALVHLMNQTYAERWGGYIKMMNAWKMIAFMSMALSIVITAAYIYQTHQSKLVPFLVYMNKMGDPLPVRPLNQSSLKNPALIRHEVANWIEESREVFGDPIAEQQIVTDLYHHTTGAAATYLTHYYTSGHNPGLLGKSQSVKVKIISVLPESDNTWRAKWEEDAYSTSGVLTGKTFWSGFIKVQIDPKSSVSDILINPLGFYVTSVSWTQENY